MADPAWTAVEQYLVDTLALSDSALDSALRANTAAGLPAIDVAPNQGKFLQLMARLTNSRRILEIGTLGGYSSIWLARALPRDGGRLTTLEADPKHAEIALSNIERAGLGALVDLRLGLALDTLPQLAAEQGPPFDLIFIDADKKSIPEYFSWALQLSRPGSLIVVDNVVRNGKVLDGSTSDADVQGVRRLFESLAAEKRVSATALQTVGSKGYDGFLLAYVLNS